MTSPKSNVIADDNGGFGLITALMFVLLIAAVMTPLAVVSRTQVLSSTYSSRRTVFELLAPGLSRVLYASNTSSPMVHGWQRCEKKDEIFYFHIQDQSGLIGLNSASNPLLKNGFLALGYNDTDATRFAERVEMFRERGSLGATVNSYPSFFPKHAPFEHIVELYDVLGTPAPELERLADVFTVYNRTDSVTVSHSSGPLRKQMERRDNEQFVQTGDLPSGNAEIVFAHFQRGEPYGFVSRIMMTRPAEADHGGRMLQKDISFSSLESLGPDIAAAGACSQVLARLTEGL
jgi:general secretion pathway protein K